MGVNQFIFCRQEQQFKFSLPTSALEAKKLARWIALRKGFLLGQPVQDREYQNRIALFKQEPLPIARYCLHSSFFLRYHIFCFVLGTGISWKTKIVPFCFKQ
jgi:hypothetical protein